MSAVTGCARVEGQNHGAATTTPPGLNLLRLEESLSAAHLRLSSTYIERLSWQDCLARRGGQGE